MARRKPAPTRVEVATPEVESAADIRADGDAVLISVRVKPRSHREELRLADDGTWLVSVRAAPSDGAANEAVISLLARVLKRAPSTCSVHRGQRSRDKIVRVANMDAPEARRNLSAFVSEEPETSRIQAADFGN